MKGANDGRSREITGEGKALKDKEVRTEKAKEPREDLIPLGNLLYRRAAPAGAATPSC
jgi:hypothetical protein